MMAKFAVFSVIGAVCTGIQYLVLIVLVERASVGAATASTIGYLLSGCVNYLLNRRFTYRSSSAHARSVPRFAAVAGVGVALNFAITYVGASLLGINYLIAQAAATAVVLMWNFSANLRWTF